MTDPKRFDKAPNPTYNLIWIRIPLLFDSDPDPSIHLIQILCRNQIHL